MERHQPPENQSTSEVLRCLVKTQKALRLYKSNNVICEKLEAQLAEKAAACLEEWGPCALTVRESEICLNGSVVYAGTDRTGSLPFLLFRDGIRTLTFLPGLDRNELHGFLDALNRVSVASNTQDNLATLLWERDFQFIRYFAVDELNEEAARPRLMDQLASGSAGSGEPRGTSPDSVSLKDLQQPFAYLPIDACRLDEAEVQALHAELTAEEQADTSVSLVELAIELAALETSAEEQRKLAWTLIKTLDTYIAQGQVISTVRAVWHLSGLAGTVFESLEPARRLCADVTAALAEPERVARVLDQLKQEGSLSPRDLASYLIPLGPRVLPTLVPRIPRLPDANFRRAAADVVVAAGDVGLQELTHHLSMDEGAPDPLLLREAVYILRQLPGSRAMPLASKLLDLPDPQFRQQGALALGPFQDGPVGEKWLELLNDADPRIYILAVIAIERSGRRELVQHLIEQTSATASAERGPVEKKRCFAAVARLAGDEALEVFASLLAKRRWIASRQTREAVQAAVHGIRTVGTAAARDLLVDLGTSGDRFVRSACHEVLRGWERSRVTRGQPSGQGETDAG
ncbi:MAG: hypothetical protein V3U86_06865 [Acidobacteriota bacterium]